MNALDQAKTAYGKTQTTTRSPRGIEYEAFARITHALKAAQSKGKAGFKDLVAAMHQNRQLWTLLASDVAESSNQLSDDLRARIFYLAEFTAVQTRRVLKDGASADALIDINSAIMGGLRAEGGAK
ncbi:flagellar biosynthesis regulator FlaF [Falsihalocynthiibacter sp. SS001]|uniref:flagellar biosynthesis regulator FlaF n=1 Tax=Falsihalocynthiibacter sp. SS001 TaxID=3349698 RepID=UPI0036D27F29